MLLEHEIEHIAERLFAKFTDRLGDNLRAVIREEMKIMTDQAVQAVSDATDAIVAELGSVVGLLTTDAAALAAALAGSASASDPALLAIAGRLTAGTQAAKDAVAALTAAPVPSPAPAPEPAPAPAPAPAATA